jgi:hypothetical protein
MDAQMDLWTIVDTIVAGSGLTIGPDCEKDLRSFVAQGETGIITFPGRRAEAVGNLSRFLAEMIDESRSQGLDGLHEPTFFAAKAKLCPLFPFC